MARDIFLQSGAAAWLLYASPPLVVILVWGMHRPGRSAAEALLYVFVAVCLAATIVFHVPVIYQHYWWARYLLSEIVPYSIVLAVALTALAGPGAFRRLGVIAILTAMPFHLYYTAKQMPVRHGSLPYAVLSRIADRVGEGVLLLDVDGFGDGPHARLQTPLSLYFGTHVFPYDADDLDAIVQSFEGVPGANLWRLTNAHDDHPDLRLSETFPYRDHRMVRSSTIPTTISERWWNQTLVLYRHEACIAPDCELRLRDGALYSLGNATTSTTSGCWVTAGIGAEAAARLVRAAGGADAVAQLVPVRRVAGGRASGDAGIRGVAGLPRDGDRPVR